jgi:hypothetical protein
LFFCIDQDSFLYSYKKKNSFLYYDISAEITSTIQDIEVRKSEHDIREYKVMNVTNSGLQALLVYDPRVVTEGEPRRKNIQLERVSI